MNLPLKIIHFLVIAGYFIYIPVSYLRNDFILFAYDLLATLGFAILLITGNTSRLRQNQITVFLFSIYVSFVFVAFAFQSNLFELQSYKSLRNYSFGLVAYLLGITYITSLAKLRYILVPTLWCSLVSCIFAFRQLFFGFYDWELDRLAIMGSSLDELILNDRIRLTGTFGSPLLCSFMMMIGVFMTIILKRLMPPRSLLPAFGFRILAAMIFVGLIGTLTRAPLIGLVVGLSVYYILKFDFSTTNAYKILIIILFVSGSYLITTTGFLENSDNYFLSKFNTMLESFSSIFGLLGGDGSGEVLFIEKSRFDRVYMWDQGLNVIASNPFGVGFTSTDLIGFSSGDTGVLEIAIMIGVPGAVSLSLLIMLITGLGFHSVVFKIRGRYKLIAVGFFALWISLIVSTTISNMLSSVVASFYFWTIAAIITNIEIICRNTSDAISLDKRERKR